MNRTIFGNANSAIEFGLLQDIKINRDGRGRVSVVGRTGPIS
jgi:hypothetical protein